MNKTLTILRIFIHFYVYHTDYLRTVIKEVSEAEERGQLDDDSANELAMNMKGPSNSILSVFKMMHTLNSFA